MVDVVEGVPRASRTAAWVMPGLTPASIFSVTTMPCTLVSPMLAQPDAADSATSVTSMAVPRRNADDFTGTQLRGSSFDVHGRFALPPPGFWRNPLHAIFQPASPEAP